MSISPPVSATALKRDLPEIDRLVSEALAKGKAPGAVVVVGRSNGIVFQRAYGHRAVFPKKKPMKLDTVFDLASLTKPIVTATLIQALADRGKLDIDDPVRHHLPEFNGKGKGPLTIRQLLLHTSGLPVSNSLNDYRKGKKGALNKIYNGFLQATPDREFLYSDVGYIVLGELIERVSGSPVDQLARELLFAPMQMTDTGYRPDPALLDRIAPTSHDYNRPTPLIHGVVHDPRAYRMGGVAGHAGLFATGPDLAKYARMLLAEGELNGERVLSRLAVQELTRPHWLPGNAVRTLGWDVKSKYSRARSALWGPRAYGHGGYTGTSLWLDPDKDLFVLFLSNRVHPFGHGKVLRLQAAIADAAVQALSPLELSCQSPAPRVRTGIDALSDRQFDSLANKRVGLVTHLAARNTEGVSTLERLQRAPEVNLVALFSPEHGLAAAHEGAIRSQKNSEFRLPVHSLYGKTMRPTAQMLSDLDVLVVDLVDVGVRFYTYMSTLHEVMRAAAGVNLPVIVLDRPNPLGGTVTSGPMLEEEFSDFVNHHPLPVRHGMSAGELAELISDEEGIGVRLQIVQAPGWRRSQLHRDTELPWTQPSPNLRSPEAALLYPAVGLLESTNLSVGRGTDLPFHHFGAPFVDASELLEAVRAEKLLGVDLETTSFTPSAGPHRERLCHGLRLRVTDPKTFQPVLTGLALARALARSTPKQWQTKRLGRMIGHASTVREVLKGTSLRKLPALWDHRLSQFKKRRAAFLRYPTCKASGE